MIRRTMSVVRWRRCRWLLVVALVAGLCSVAWADLLAPGPNDRHITLAVSSLVSRQHLTRHPLDKEISERCLKTFLEGVGPDEGLLLPVRRRPVHAAQGRVVRCDPQGRHQLRLYGVSHVLAAGGRAGEDGRRVAGHAARFHGRRADGDRPRHGPISPRCVRGPRPLAETDQVRPAGAEGRQEGRCRGEDKPAKGRRTAESAQGQDRSSQADVSKLEPTKAARRRKGRRARRPSTSWPGATTASPSGCTRSTATSCWRCI